MGPDAFLDTNVLLRHVLHDHPDHSPRSSRVIEAIEAGARAVRLTDTIVFETVFTLEKTYAVPRDAIREVLQPIIDLPGIVLPGKRLYTKVFDLWIQQAGLSFADCYHLCVARHLGIPTIISFDRKLNRLPGVTLVEP